MQRNASFMQFHFDIWISDLKSKYLNDVRNSQGILAATKLHTVAVLLSSLFSRKVKSSSIIQRRDRDLFKLLSQSKIYTMHSNIGGIHTNGPTLSNTTTHYILHTPIPLLLLLYIQSLRALFFSFFFFSLELENLENCFSKLFKSIFPGKHLD